MKTEQQFECIAIDVGGVFQHMEAYIRVIGVRMEELIGVNDPEMLLLSREGAWKFCIQKGSWKEMGIRTLQRLEDRALFDRCRVMQERTCAELVRYAKEFRKQDFQNMNAERMIFGWKELWELWFETIPWGHLGNLADFEHFTLSNTITDFVTQRCKESHTNLLATEMMAVLTTPSERSLIQQQDIDLLKLLAKVQAHHNRDELLRATTRDAWSVDLELLKLLDHHVEDYDWIQFQYDGPTIVDHTYFLANLSGLAHQGVDAGAEYSKLEADRNALQIRQKELEQQLRFSDREKYFLEMARTFMYLKALRKDSVYLCQRSLDPFFREVARRLYISPTQARQISIDEMPEVLRSQTVNPERLNDRRKFCALYAHNGTLDVFTGKEAESWEQKVIEEKVQDVNELQGSCAYPGTVRGIVRIVMTENDMSKMQKGDILVSAATNPNLLPVMKIAGGFVTNEGGVTCHAAIVARELKKPCVIGTRTATRVFKDGDRVEVDAAAGIVRKLD